jgi:drug/metabolite transporter (DMT)-like permease
LRVFFLTAAALVGFSANSLLTRSALGAGRLDPASFTAVRLVTGALTLVTSDGIWLAIASGSIASGLGYTLWYAALPALAAWRAAVVQLIVPILTALCAAGLLDEALTGRLFTATMLVSAGVALTVWPSKHGRPV